MAVSDIAVLFGDQDRPSELSIPATEADPVPSSKAVPATDHASRAGGQQPTTPSQCCLL